MSVRHGSIRRRFMSVVVAGFLALAMMVAGSYVTPTMVHADTLGYPWPTDTEAPCEFGSNGGSSCTNPASGKSWDKYDWYVDENGDGQFGSSTNRTGCGSSGASSECFDQWGYEYRNCTSYVAWRESTIGITVPNSWGNGGDWYSKAPTSEQSTTPKAWDAAVVLPTTDHPAGHVAFIESVNSVDPNNPLNDNITVSEYNHDTQGHGDTWTGKASDRGFTKFVDFGVHPSGSSGGSGGSTTTPTSTTSQITPDGVQHLYTGNSSGIVYDISWGNGAPLVQWSVANLGSSVTALSSQLVAGVQHVYAATGSSVYDISWGNGSPLVSWRVAAFSASVNSLSSQVTLDGVQHVYSAVGSTVQDTSWGNGASLTTWQVGSSSAAVSSLSSHLVNGVQHVYASVGTTVQDISWGNGAPLVQWQVANLGVAVVGLTAQLVNGVQYVDAATASTVQNISWGNGAPLTVWQVGNFAGATIKALSSQVTPDGVQHVYVGTATGTMSDISWGNGAPLVQWQIANLGSSVVGITAQLMGGVQQADAITSSAAWNVSWGNGAPLTQWKVAASL